MKHTADLAEEQAAGDQVRRLLVTLTYRPGVEWAARHLSDFIDAARVWMRRRGHALVYIAVAELQQRGAVHFHVLLWLPARLMMPHPDRRGWWKHGMSNVKPCRRPVAYLAKYASKMTSKLGERFPRGLRLHANGGLCVERRRWRAWLMLPRYVRAVSEPCDDWQRVSGGFIARATGEFLRSRWRLDSHAPDWSWVRFVEIEQ